MTKLISFAIAIALLAAPTAIAGKPRDRDHDRMPDRWEKVHKLKVGKRDGAKDADRDGLSNLKEYRAKTNPRKADTDRDGLRDGDERRNGCDPRDPDTDGDGMMDGPDLRAEEELEDDLEDELDAVDSGVNADDSPVDDADASSDDPDAPADDAPADDAPADE